MVKFRGKRVDNGEWVYFNHFGIYCDNEGNELQPKRFIRDCGYKVDPETLGMGVEIGGKWYFEGDVCSFVFDGNNRIEPITLVDGSLCLGYCISLRKSQIDYHKETKGSLEIIGNKWDNPELGVGE